jgi:uncharacterized OB-fold protein
MILVDDRPLIDDAEPFSPFVAGLARQTLLLQHCTTCATVQLGRLRCEKCLHATFRWVRSGERGHLHTFTVLHRAFHPAFTASLPYAVGVVELAEGPRLSAILTTDAARLRAAMPMRVDWTATQARGPLCFMEDDR